MVQLLGGPLFVLLVGVLTVVGTARATRLWVFDAWPPVAWLRGRFLAWAEQTREVSTAGARTPTAMQVYTSKRHDLTWRAGWAPLATCPFCVAPWFALGSLLWFLLSGAASVPVHLFEPLTWAGAWWEAHIWFTVSYLASMVVVRDEPADD